MNHNNFSKKRKALALRRRGISMTKIEKRLNIARSTLSFWFRDIKLTTKQKNRLRKNSENAFKMARLKAVLWHNAEKAKRLMVAKRSAEMVLNNINLDDKNIIELALSMLYLGEGNKKNETSIGNSDPLILKTFVNILRNDYRVGISKIKCGLHIRVDQDPMKVKKFWSNVLNLPVYNFTYIVVDKRTAGRKTYPNYNGVCVVRCGNVAIQRKLINISKGFCNLISSRA